MEENLNEIKDRILKIRSFLGDYSLNDKELVFIEEELNSFDDKIETINKDGEEK